MSPKVSILVPIYNTSRFIEKCAISLFEQTFQDIEYIFINDCTPDNSIEILKNVIDLYPNRKKYVKILEHQENKGLASSRNTGIANAKGEYILHVDSDDYIDLYAVELLYNKAIQDNADIVMCDASWEWNKTSKLVIQNIGNSNQDCLEMILSGKSPPCVWNKLFKRELYINNRIKALDGVNFGEDYLVTPQLIYFSNKISKVDKPLYHYIQFNTNAYTKNISKKSVYDIISVLNELTRFFKEKEDYFLYREVLLRAKLRKKIEMLMNVSLSDLRELFNIFPEVDDYRDVSFLTFREKISYFFIKNKWVDGFILYRRLYKFLFYLYKVCKGR
ncbi:glycosyltransferase family 2 protein [Actinobacillus pleuropneumoniae]|uniref:glycosyltransferase family 2 protein n=1 Tax=Actinobacillus pleuropneumoniae TaxID=715 RepID=UPI00201CE536|nr:glycosyltransferase [Actinobacillus pleuropneumoniae]UQZ25487.1 glycosyltransferase [Actinobacillus pleuropneumoniae]